MKKKQGKWVIIFLLWMIPALLKAGDHRPHKEKRSLKKLTAIKKIKIGSNEEKAALTAHCNITNSVISK